MKIFRRQIGFIVVMYLLNVISGSAQETVFSGLKSDLKRADRYFQNQSFQKALDLYVQAEKKGKGEQEVYLKIARTYYRLNQADQAATWFEKYVESNNSLSANDAYDFAESLTAQSRYMDAIKWYKEYQKSHPESQSVTEKIWRLMNIEYLYSDSSYYEIKPVSFNTPYAEYGASYIDEGLAFVSNRKDKRGVINIDPITNQPFQSLYKVGVFFDSARNSYSFGKPKTFLRDQNKKGHQGQAAVSESKLIFTRSTVTGSNNESTLQLYWVEKQRDLWNGERPFKYNSNQYSVSYPSLSEDGKTLFFVSDMPGGIGGKDLYKCIWNGTGWSRPENLGNVINTTGDETAPFIHNDLTLYFASNGHGGFGGLDVFKVIATDGISPEVQNLGFPINTPADDFGLILNTEGSHGYFSSNRGNGGFNDDIFEVIVDLQSYPLTIGGIVRFNDPDWSESSRLEILPDAHLRLIDNLRNATVYQTYTDQQGIFSLNIPYSSKYKIQVSQELVGQPIVSLEIPKNRKLYTAYEIVVVKEKFKKSKESGDLKVSNEMKFPTGKHKKTKK